MIETILEYSGIVFSAVGIICLCLEAFETFKRKANTKLMIAGLICLTISVIGSVITGIILREMNVSSLFNIAWIALLWAYLVCNIVSVCLETRKNRAEKRKLKSEQAVAATTVNDEQSVDIDETADNQNKDQN